MAIMGIGMEKADGHGLHIFLAQLLRQALQGGFIERHQNIAIGGQALLNREAQGSRHQRHGAVDHQVIVIEALFVALFENVAETLGGDEGGLRALSFDQRIGGKGGAVNEHADVGGLYARLFEDKADAFDDAQFRRLRGGQNLAAPALGSCFEDNIGESAADIGGEFDGFVHGRDTYYCARANPRGFGHGWVDRARTVAAMFSAVLLSDSHLATGYRHFVAVATLGSVRAASRQLNVAASAISRQVGLLEAQLGIALFERHTRSLALTEAGVELLRGLQAANQTHEGTH